MSDDTADWRRVDVDDVQKDIDEWDLVSSLSSGALPPRTLVWKRGWQEWLPACRVAELASAIPEGKTEPVIEPKLGDNTEPPPLPLDRPDVPISPTRAAISPPPPPVAGSGLGSASALSLLGKIAPGTPPPPPPLAARPPMPTLVEPPPTPTSSATLRPPGAVPPPPRRMPAHPAPAPRVPVLETPLPQIAIREKSPDDASAPPQVAAVATRGPAPAAPVPAPVPEPPTLPLASPAPIAAPVAADAEPLPSWDVESAPDAAAAPLAPIPPRVGSVAAPARSSTLTIVLGAIVGALAALVIVLLIARGTRHDAPLAATAGSPAASESAGVQRGPCTLARPAKRLATDILQSVPPYLAAAPDGQHVVVGFAASRTEAVGLMVNPVTLDAARAFDQKGSENVVGVVPSVASGRVDFAVDREDPSLHDARSVDATPRFVLGMNDQGLVRSAGGKPPALIWPGGAGDRMTEIRVATTARGDHAVTFRRGGQSGGVLVGWLDARGAKKSKLQHIDAPAFVGTPMVAANDDSILVAFAARDKNTDYWNVELATARHGELPTAANPFNIPAGGPGHEAISPAATALGSRWLLQWTEGTTGEHDVRVQTLDDKLVPVGDPVTVSPKGANAGQGVVWVHGDKGVSLFIVASDRSHELWGAALKCP